MSQTVNAIAKLTGVSIRTLHYYDEIKLLAPSGRSGAGYRLYSEADLQRLQMILFYRELGFDLREIKRVLSDPKFDRKSALLQHRRTLIENHGRLTRLIQTVDHTLNSIERNGIMTSDMFEGFDVNKHQPEAERRWGNTAEYKESQRRTKSYTKADWDAIKAEGAEIYRELASLMDQDPASAEVQRWIGRHHKQINDRFYACSAKIYRGLADLYVDDPSFRGMYDNIKPGLAEFLSAGMRIYADAMTQN